MPENDDLPSLEALEKKLEKAQKEQQEEPAKGEDIPGGPGMAMRVGIELMAGVGVGMGAGYYLDKWLGTAPWLFLLCFVLGTCGGGLNIYRMFVNPTASDNTNEPK